MSSSTPKNINVSELKVNKCLEFDITKLTDANYNWDEGRPICTDYYKPVKEQLENTKIEEFGKNITKQLD
jgi:hypothetical protein